MVGIVDRRTSAHWRRVAATAVARGSPHTCATTTRPGRTWWQPAAELLIVKAVEANTDQPGERVCEAVACRATATIRRLAGRARHVGDALRSVASFCAVAVGRGQIPDQSRGLACHHRIGLDVLAYHESVSVPLGGGLGGDRRGCRDVAIGLHRVRVVSVDGGTIGQLCPLSRPSRRRSRWPSRP